MKHDQANATTKQGGGKPERQKLTPQEEEIPNIWLNLATSTQRINDTDIVVQIEVTAMQIGREKGDELRWRVR